MAWYRCGGGGGSSGGNYVMERVATDAVISADREYKTDTIPDISGYDVLVLSFIDDTVPFPNKYAVPVSQITSGGSLSFSVSLTSSNVVVALTPTTVGTTYYNGAWRVITCTIDGWRSV